MQIIFEDSEKLWQNAWIPTKGDSLRAYIGYVAEKLSISWEVERNPGDDMYEKIIFVLDNGYKLEIWCFTDYMEIEEVKP